MQEKKRSTSTTSKPRTNKPAKTVRWQDKLRPDPAQTVLNPAVEQIVHAIVHGELLLPSSTTLPVGEQVLSMSRTGHIHIAMYHPAFDEVRMHCTQISALCSLGVDYRAVLTSIIQAQDQDGASVVLLGPKLNSKTCIDAQPVVISIFALYAAVRHFYFSKEQA